MKLNAFINSKIEKSGSNKKEIYLKMKEYFSLEDNDEWIAYNTFVSKLSSNSLSAKELIVLSAILEININSILNSIKFRLDELGIISKKLEDADDARIAFMKEHSAYNLENYINECLQVEKNVFEFISYDINYNYPISLKRIAIEQFDFNKNKRKTIAFAKDYELPKDPSDYICEHYAEQFSLDLDDGKLYDFLINSKKEYYILYPEELELPNYVKEDYDL